MNARSLKNLSAPKMLKSETCKRKKEAIADLKKENKEVKRELKHL
jgi:hypothetical protein